MDEPKEILQSVVRKKIDLINSSQEVYQHLHTMFLYVLCDVGRINYADAEMLFKFMRSIQEKYKNRFATSLWMMVILFIATVLTMLLLYIMTFQKLRKKFLLGQSMR